VHDPVLSRRSVRKYTTEPVTDEHVERLLRAAMAAPSAGDQRPWQFVVVRDRATLAAITEVHPYARMLHEAPLAIVVCGDTELEKWLQFWEQDCAAATENLLVEAEALGLGAVWLGVHPLTERVEGLRRLLDAPGHVVPFAVVAVGHPAQRKPPSDRYDPARVHHDSW
jgi:nitroreductase